MNCLLLLVAHFYTTKFYTKLQNPKLATNFTLVLVVHTTTTKRLQ